MARADAVDAHDPPAWMRELVILRDRHCVFPWCTRDARASDLDHITPYEENGPPGQPGPPLAAFADEITGPRPSDDGLSPHPGRHYQWTDPTGQTYLVTPDRHHPLPAQLRRALLRHLR